MRVARVIFAVAVSAVLYFSGTGLHAFWPATWVAPLPILLLAFGESWPVAALAASVAYGVGELNMVGVLEKIMPPPVIAILLLPPSLIFAVAVLAGRATARRLPTWAAPLGFALASTAFDFL